MKTVTIPVCDMRQQYLDVAHEIEAVTKEVLSGGTYILGNKVRAFEQAMSQLLSGRHCVGVGSGTDALELALRGLELKPDDEVIIPAHSYPTAWGVLNAGVQVKTADIDPVTWLYDIQSLEKTLSPKTKVLVVVHLYGLNMLSQELHNWARENNLLILEDCAQSLSARDGSGALLGTLGDISTFSFYPTKPLGGYGDGGLIATPSKEVSDRIQALRMYGEVSRYNSTMIGTNSRLDELQAAFLLVKLPHMEQWRQERQAQAERYTKAFSGIKGLALPQNPDLSKSSFHLYLVRTNKRSKLQAFLLEAGIITAIHYPLSLTEVPSLKDLFTTNSAPNAEKHCQEVLSLPLYNGLPEKDQEAVITQVLAFFQRS